MKFILFPFLALTMLICLLIISYKRRWFLKDLNNQNSISKASSIKYYILVIGLIITMLMVIYRELTDYF
jgi:hypothetical protein